LKLSALALRCRQDLWEKRQDLYKQQGTKGVLWIHVEEIRIAAGRSCQHRRRDVPAAFPLIGGTYGDAKSASNLLADKGELAVEVSSAQPAKFASRQTFCGLSL
jgi:hypothetical protein